MIRYRLTPRHEDGMLLVESESIVPGSIAINIPDDEKLKRRFVSLYLHVADIEEALNYLFCVSADKSPIVNRALFLSALVCMMKCFQTSSACNALDEEDFKKNCPDPQEFERFKEWRNKHFVHDENSMREACAFLIIAPENHNNLFGGEPSVVWESAPIDYVQEGRRLESVLQSLWRYAIAKFDKIAIKLKDKYGEKSREELLALGQGKMKKPTVQNPDITR